MELPNARSIRYLARIRNLGIGIAGPSGPALAAQLLALCGDTVGRDSKSLLPGGIVTIAGLLSNPALTRALVLGLFGGAGLVLTTVYSRRGPLIYPVYAAFLAALTMLLARYPGVTYPVRFAIALAGFLTASALLYVAVSVLGDRQRERLRREGRLPPGGGVRFFGHLWRVGFLVAVGAVVSAGVAFIAA